MTTDSFRTWLQTLAAAEATVPARIVLERLPEAAATPAPDPLPVSPSADWRERLWTAPAETRFGIVELCEATGKPKSWAYRHTSQKSGKPLIPHRKLDGALIFTAGEVRAWLREHEQTVHEGPMESTPTERGSLRALPRAS